jgi:hypothetical protein
MRPDRLLPTMPRTDWPILRTLAREGERAASQAGC